ncbi:MAG: NAD(P)-binding domain-containing protein [Actinomycetota bacterium]
MQVGMLGTGGVARTLALRLRERGNDVAFGTRDVEATKAKHEPDMMGNPSFAEWHTANPGFALKTFSEAAQHGEVVINATNGAGSLDALRAAGAASLDGKILMDLSNPLDFSKGFPPTLLVVDTDSLGEQIQRELPNVKVVKTLSTMNMDVMAYPDKVGGGDHAVFVCGNDAEAKARVSALLSEWFGWRDIVDVGDITSARGTEMYIPLWLRLMGAPGTTAFNIKVVR